VTPTTCVGVTVHAPATKKKLILAGKLTEKGRPNEKTPRDWLLGQGRWSWLPKLTGEKEEEQDVVTEPPKKRKQSEVVEEGESTIEKKKKKKKAAAEEE